jgi:hypothetical protein
MRTKTRIYVSIKLCCPCEFRANEPNRRQADEINDPRRLPLAGRGWNRTSVRMKHRGFPPAQPGGDDNF